MDPQDNTDESPHRHAVRAYPGLERLIVAALADPSFAAALLADPATAVEHASGMLQLTHHERDLAISITGATDIHDFAARLHAKMLQDQARAE
jgi:hypothetical protein